MGHWGDSDYLQYVNDYLDHLPTEAYIVRVTYHG